MYNLSSSPTSVRASKIAKIRYEQPADWKTEHLSQYQPKSQQFFYPSYTGKSSLLYFTYLIPRLAPLARGIILFLSIFTKALIQREYVYISHYTKL